MGRGSMPMNGKVWPSLLQKTLISCVLTRGHWKFP